MTNVYWSDTIIFIEQEIKVNNIIATENLNKAPFMVLSVNTNTSYILFGCLAICILIVI